MNIIKGIDRIALVISIIAILPGFLTGFTVIRDVYKAKSPEYIEWEKNWEKRKQEMRAEAKKKEEKYIDEMKKKNPFFRENDPLSHTFYPAPFSNSYISYKNELNDPLYKSKPQEYQYPIFGSVIVGIIFGFLFFLILLFTIRGMSRGIKHFSLWIIDGFRDDKKTKE